MSDFATLAAKVDQLQTRLSTYVAPLSTGTPVVSGVAAVGNTLTCTRGTWDNGVASYAYQWKSAAVNVGTSVPTYAPVAGDVTKAITCVVSATNTFGTTVGPASNGVTISY
jgi:hypothetical protein